MAPPSAELAAGAELAAAAVHPFVKTVRSRFGFTVEEELRLRYLVVGSATLSLFGASVIIYSAVRFKELSRRFFAIRLIFFLSVTDLLASVFNVLGAFVDVHTVLITETSTLCYVQALGLLYFNLASITWTSCFAFTLYRDVVPSYRRFALRKYEVYFHALCWPLPGVLSLVCWRLKLLGDAGSWCAIRSSHAREYLLVFYLPLVLAFGFNVGTYALVWWGSRERRVTRTTSLYLLAFAFVWLPSLTKAIKVYFFDLHAGFALAAAEAICMPLQGALNAAVYGWSLPSIRDFYKSLFLGYESLDARRGPVRSHSSSRSPSSRHDDESTPPAPVAESPPLDAEQPGAFAAELEAEKAGTPGRASDPKRAPLLARRG
ncbi:hypothetical protein KFE25_004224 [Diacronema lutheri]|uniref:G-protein coupled receptors family 2 profile 2 domain-containing protein n=1 Tax=Diacronema lutheri TaxID=2081491 RepID=A0A8J5XEQ1_DIALT|nr:hypothetical protein KFE25_004224 [Diacronema lutheri]